VEGVVCPYGAVVLELLSPQREVFTVAATNHALVQSNQSKTVGANEQAAARSCAVDVMVGVKLNESIFFPISIDSGVNCASQPIFCRASTEAACLEANTTRKTLAVSTRLFDKSNGAPLANSRVEGDVSFMSWNSEVEGRVLESRLGVILYPQTP